MGFFSGLGKVFKGALGLAGGLSGAGSVLSGIGAVGSLFGGGFNAKDTRSAASIAAQMNDVQFRQRIATAAELGIHPLAAIGAAGAGGSATPIFDVPLGDKLSAAGQNISRAVQAYQSKPSKALADLSLEHAALQNDLLRAQIRQLDATTVGSPPSFPSGQEVVPGQGDAFEPREVPDVGRGVGRRGFEAVVPSQDIKNRIEDMFIPESQWYLRQLVAPKVKGRTYNPFTGELVPDRNSWIRRVLDNTIFSGKTWGRRGTYFWNR